MPKYNFRFGSRWLSEFGASSAEPPTMEIAQRDVSFVSIPGKDGDECIDNKRYGNVEMKRKIAFRGTQDFNARGRELNLIRAYAYCQGYQEFEDTDHPGFVTLAALKNFKQVQQKLLTLHTAELVFSRKPFWFLKTGLEPQPLDMTALAGSGVAICNPFPAPACPVYRFDLTFVSGADTNTSQLSFAVAANYDGAYSEKIVNCGTVIFTATHHYVVIDTENKRASVQNADGDVYKYIDMTVPAPIGEGDAVIRLINGGKTSAMTITPQWRSL